jgi:hypothetical protein
LNPKVKVTPKEDGAIISIDGYDINITIQPTEEAPIVTTQSQIEFVKSRLEDYLGELEIREEVTSIVVEPKSFLGRDRFASIATIVEELGGSYISAGRESRFLIPKK